MRGLNNNKASPDSGWTFPGGMMTQPVIPGVTPQQAANFMLGGNNGNKIFQPTINNDNRNSSSFVRDSMYRSVIPNSFSPKVMTPYGEMTLRQQQQLFESASLNQSNCGFNMFPVRSFDAMYSSVNNQHNSSPDIFQVTRLPTPLLTPTEAMQNNLSNTRFSKENLQSENTQTKFKTMDSSTQNFKLTPAGTPSNDIKTLHDSLIQPFLNFKPSLTIPDIRYINTPLQSGVAVHSYFPSAAVENTSKIQADKIMNKETFKKRQLLDSSSTISSNSLHDFNMETKTNIHKNNGINKVNFDTSQSSLIGQTTGSYHISPHTSSNNFARLNNFGNLKPSEEQQHQQYGLDRRVYEAASTCALIPNKHEVYTSADISQHNKTMPSHPQRPKHLGSNFIPQTHFLSVNINHATTPNSDKESILSSNSPGRHSPYSNSSRNSGSPSPHNVKADKAKDRPDNTCSQCGKQFSSSSALAKHALIHSDERKYVCQICSRGFKRQDHLNGHMITHRDKKPYECHIPDCGKSYCDSRSLRRHLENHHHSSPIGGATPGSYMPTLYPEYPEEMMRNTSNGKQQSSNRLLVPEPQRPSSAPPVPPEAKRITRNRRSSSGEETGLQLDPMMLREIEAHKMKVYGHSDIIRVSVNNSSTNVTHSVQSRYSPHPTSLLAKSSAGIATASDYTATKPDYGFDRKHEQYRTEYNKFYADYNNKHREQLLESAHPGTTVKGHYNEKTDHPHTLLQDGENKSRKVDYSASGFPPTYPPGIGPPMINPRFMWNQQSSSQSTSSSSMSASMPYLLNIRTPFNVPTNGQFPPPLPHSDDTKDQNKSDHIRQQAMNTYLQMWANGQRGSLTPEQITIYQNQMIRPSQNLPTPTDPTAIAVATAKEHSERPYSLYRESYYNGIHPSIAQWQQTVMHDDNSRKNEKDSKPNYFPHPSMPSQHANNNNDINYLKGTPTHESAASRFTTQERNIIDEPFKPSESNQKSDHYRYNLSPHRMFYDRIRPMNYPPTSHLHEHASAYEEHLARKDIPHSLEPTRLLEADRRPIGELSKSDQRTIEHPRTLEIPKKSPISPHCYDTMYAAQKRDIPRVHIESLATTPSALSPGKKRPRPGPIIIPPAVNHRSIPGTLSPKSILAITKNIYTPPAMLSPRSVFFNPPAPTPKVAHPPGTPARFLLSVRRSTSIDQREASVSTSVSSEEQLQTSTEVPEPKINVGLQFQAVLPSKVDRSEAQKDIHRASLMWAPIKEDEVKNEEINAYLSMACSLALYGGSNNKEYALHILQRTRGNVKEAVRLLLSRRHILRADDPNADYHYSGSVRWTAKERLAFRQAYRTKGKVFTAIQNEIATKSVQLCVEFYYLWKAMHPESFRARTRIVEVESEQDDEEVPPTPTAAVAPLSTLREPVFECDYPECRARFVSRQALNGHIRVHGGSFSKPSETRRPKQKSGLVTTPGSDGIPSLPSPPKKKKAATTASVIVTNTTDGPQLQFQCKVCGRVFGKVKSRSAHMKTHVKRDENNKPIKTPKSQKQLQQKQLQQQKRQQKQNQNYPPIQPLPLPTQYNPHEPSQQHHNPHEPPSSMNPMTLYAHA